MSSSRSHHVLYARVSTATNSQHGINRYTNAKDKMIYKISPNDFLLLLSLKVCTSYKSDEHPGEIHDSIK